MSNSHDRNTLPEKSSNGPDKVREKSLRRRFPLPRRRPKPDTVYPSHLDVSRADLHMHSSYSDKPPEWIMRRLGCPECFTPPRTAYEMARRRGMQFVTITDHDCIMGASEIADLPGTFISEEVTTYFPEDGCKLHVVTMDITPAQHQEIQKIRRSVYDLAAFLNENNIIHYIAHPLYPNNRRMDVEKVEKLLLLFKIFEQTNGHHTTNTYLFFNEVLDNLTPEIIQEISEKHQIKPYGTEPWIKCRTGGSDDHGMLCIGTTWTETRRVETVREFLQEIVAGRSRPGGEYGTSNKLAHSIYSVAYNFYSDQVLKDSSPRGFISTVFDRLLEKDQPEPNSYLRSVLRILRKIRRRRNRKDINPIVQMFKKESLSFLDSNPDLRRQFILGKPITEKQEIMFRFACHVSNGILYEYVKRLMKALPSGNLYEIFQTASALGAVHFFLSPYYFSFSHVHRDRPFLRQVQRRFLGPKSEGSARVALFTDTLSEVNGVVRVLEMVRENARKLGRSVTVVTAGHGPSTPSQDVVNFEPVGVFPLPEYSELTICVPPGLEMIEYCERNLFDVIHAVTPGPMGLASLLMARIFSLPLIGTYHTDLPSYVMHFTEDPRLRDLTWRYLRWFYGQMDQVIVPSESTRNQLVENGFDESRIVVIPHGVDTIHFTPEQRDESIWSRFKTNGKLKLLYVGRISKEKNLDRLMESFKRLHQRRNDIELIVVGDGPYRQSLESHLHGYPVTFTGYREGKELSALYASADLFVFPSTTDTMGNVVLEAQASGLPVIVSDKGGPKECLEPDVTGKVFPAEDIDALTDTIECLINDSEMRRTMGRNARKLMETRTHERSFLSFWDVHERALRNE